MTRTDESDARLLALFREWQAAKSRDDESDAATKAATALEFAIQEIPAQTLAGLAVKATIATEYVDEPVERRLLDDIVFNVLRDVIPLRAPVQAQRTT
jgi:hypothetical protein